VIASLFYHFVSINYVTLNKLTLLLLLFKTLQATNTCTQGLRSERSTNTEKLVAYPAATNTEPPSRQASSTSTDTAVFHNIRALAHVGTEMDYSGQVQAGVNTDIVGDVDAVSARPATACASTTTVGVVQVFDKSVNTAALQLVEKGMVRETHMYIILSHYLFTVNI